MDSSASQPSLKRPRTEGPPQPIRSTPWFDDGNIILEAELSQFRVYRGILSAHSVIFKDMFALAQPSGEGDVEGCPVVHLSDRAEDVRIILEVLHDSIQSHISLRGRVSLAKVAAFYRLGTKYEIPDLRIEAIRRLSNDYPDELELFDQNRNSQLIEGRAADVVNLAREMNILSVLPSALYCCSAFYTTGEILGGKKRSDGSTAIMSLDDQKICLLGRDKLTRLQATETFSWLANEFEGSCLDLKCVNGRDALIGILFIWSPACRALHRRRRIWEREFCAPCVAAFADSHALGRKNIWNLLPSIFDLPPWEELLKT